MTTPPYKRFSRVLRSYYPHAAATLALVIALVGVPGVTAGGLLITSKQIKNNSITSKDIRKSAIKTTDIGSNAVRSADIGTEAVQSADIGTGQVSSADIGTGEVTPQDVAMPDPSQIKFNGTASLELLPPEALVFNKVTDLGSYAKLDPSSALEVTWTGSVEGRNGGETSGCVFQLRVDGAPSPNGGGEVFAINMESVAASALFPNLPAGPHTVEVWAKVNVDTTSNRCVIGPEKAGVGQTVVVEEKVL